jgi:hypothetical protein
MDNSSFKKKLTTLAVIGLLILVLFAASFAWFYNYAGVAGEDKFIAFLRFWIYSYWVGSSVYVGLFAARFAKGKRSQAWFWGIAAVPLTLLFILGFPSLLSPLFPHQSSLIFGGPAIFAFLAPIFSALLIVVLISIRRKATV